MGEYIKYLDLIIATLSLCFTLQLVAAPLKRQTPKKILLIIFILYFVVFSVLYLFYAKKIPYYLTGYIIWSANLLVYPLYYLYLKSLTKESFALSKKQVVYFIPFILVFVMMLYLYLQGLTKGIFELSPTNAIKQDYNYTVRIIYFIALYINLVQFLAYSILMYIMLRRHRQQIKEYFSYEEDVSLRWFGVFLIIFVLYHSFDTFVDIFNIIEKVSAEFRIFILFTRVLYVLFLGIFGLRQSQIYRQIQPSVAAAQAPNSGLTEAEGEGITDKIKAVNIGIVRHTPMLREEHKQKIMEKIERVMEEKKLYRNSYLSIYDLTKEIYTNKTYISISINDIKKMNFNSYINSLRIEDASEMLKSKPEMPINEIMEFCGFNSRSAFISSFKKYKGTIPSEYRGKR